MLKSKKFNQSLKEFNTESKGLTWCVNHFPFTEFLKGLKGEDTNLKDVKILLHDKNTRFAFLSFCTNQKDFYVLSGANLVIYNDKKACSLSTIKNLIVTLCLLPYTPTTEKVITGYKKETNSEGKEVNKPIFENKTQIGFDTLCELWKKTK